ncbi:MAG: VOC family protein [Chloroflexota bacterium]|nr:VOC family protein [Chloroflexota bacterium]MEE3245905.1 VOC family protein [Chloroflexota bacterium]|tara:strand:- start:68 stop:508 length:441 start_codon:yes stop_codon:yes gene_type:complete
MGLLDVQDVTHWSIAVNNLEESEEFYGEFLGLELVGRLGNSRMTCFKVAEHRILLAERKNPQDVSGQSEEQVHHSFTVSTETLIKACKLFLEHEVPIDQLVHRKQGFFTGRELYFFDPSGNKLELRDPTWSDGMPEATVEELAQQA